MSDHLPYCAQCGQMFRGFAMRDTYQRAHPESEHGKDLNRALCDGWELVGIEPDGIRVFRRISYGRDKWVALFSLLALQIFVLAALTSAMWARN